MCLLESNKRFSKYCEVKVGLKAQPTFWLQILIYVKFFSNSNDNFTCLIYDCICNEGKGVWARD